MVTCRERADLLTLVGDVYSIFYTNPCGILGQVWYLILSFPDFFCRPSDYVKNIKQFVLVKSLMFCFASISVIRYM